MGVSIPTRNSPRSPPPPFVYEHNPCAPLYPFCLRVPPVFAHLFPSFSDRMCALQDARHAFFSAGDDTLRSRRFSVSTGHPWAQNSPSVARVTRCRFVGRGRAEFGETGVFHDHVAESQRITGTVFIGMRALPFPFIRRVAVVRSPASPVRLRAAQRSTPSSLWGHTAWRRLLCHE